MAALGLVLSGAPALSQGILPPDAAARAFDEGREAVRKGRFADGLRLLQQALATGHTQPKEQLGTTRGFVDRYDPHYWLGVAYMETGDDVRAREAFLRSRAAGPVERWPEGRDLADRLARLDQREAARRPRPTESAPAPAPNQSPIPLPTRPAETAVSIPAEGFTTSGATPGPDSLRAPASPGPATPERLVVPGPAAELAELAPALQALQAASWSDVDQALARFRERAPAAPLSDLVDAVAKGSRYLLEGRGDASLLAEARRLLQSYRKRGGAKKAEEILVSPALASVLSF